MSPRIPGGGFKRKLISLARDLARKPRDVEHAIVVFEDGWVSPIISQGLKYGTFIPLRNSIHGYAIAVLHTHPVPRTCLLYTSPSPRDRQKSRMPSSA